MARNKHPEETVEKILAVSAKLFMEKGYEHTTLQDIIDNLGGLTKGAIYHHFKGKEEILLAIADRMGEQTEAWMRTVRDDPGPVSYTHLGPGRRASPAPRRPPSVGWWAPPGPCPPGWRYPGTAASGR